MKIAYVLNDFDVGGMASWVYSLASRLHESHEINFLCTHIERIAPKFKKFGRTEYFGRNGKPDWTALYQYLKRHRFDVVQYGHQRLFAACALAANIPVVIERTDGIRGGVGALLPKPGIDAVVASTKGTISEIGKIFDSRRIHLIYNGVDLNRFSNPRPDRLGFSDDEIIVGRVSRLGGGKNIGLLIDATRELKDPYPNIRLVIVGGNSKMPGAQDEETALRQRARGLEDFVRFTGHSDEPENLIAGFDIGTCVSRKGNEGIPNSLMECMAAGKPVLATAIDGIPELVEDGKDGFLVPDNDLDATVRKLKALIDDKNTRMEMGLAARKKIESDFNLDNQVTRYSDLYENLLEKAQGRGNSTCLKRIIRGRFGMVRGR